VALLVAAGVLAAGAVGAAGREAIITAASIAPNAYAVPAVREPLTTSPQSPVIHDTETDAIVAHAGHLFATTDQWEYPGHAPTGQILMKSSKKAAWTVFEQTQSLRVQETLDSFPIPKDQGLGSGHSLLITHAVVDGRSEIQWLIDRAPSFAPANSYVLSSTVADVRSFGAHESGGVWAVYAGVEPSGILRGIWSPTKHTLVFDTTPELTAAASGSAGSRTQKVTGFADCAGASYVSINTTLFRRNDGNLPPGVPRWVLVYQEPPVGAFNSGLRGLTCVTHDHSPSLLMSTEGSGQVYRLDHLPRGRLDAATTTASPGYGLTALVPTLEFSPVSAIRQMLSKQGTTVPTTGKGSIDYVIVAYNNFKTITVDGVTRQVFGFEWAYLGGCPSTRSCGPTALGAATFDAAACFAARTDDGQSTTYAPRCLNGPQFTLPTGATTPIRSGQAFVSIRTIQPSPFGDGELYYGGYDCNFYPADGTAWIATSTPSALHLDDGPNAAAA
jgi:hypothetical protein